MIKKFTVTGLLCLFVWNVALATVPGFLLCLHEDLLLHVDSSSDDTLHCEETHGHEVDASQEDACCVVDEDCTDLELSGAELIPRRVNEGDSMELPIMAVVTILSQSFVLSDALSVSFQQPPSRAPPSMVYWLTDIYISKTVLRV